VPRKGELLSADGLRFEVLEASDTLVEKLRVSRIAPLTAIPSEGRSG
jgi:CBS domain containing-hemolysin-like protein